MGALVRPFQHVVGYGARQSLSVCRRLANDAAGRLFSYVSLVGHFSFLVFTSYVLILFPLTFIVVSQRLMRFISVVLATVGMTLLLIDSEVFTRFHLHLQSLCLGTGD